MGSIFESARYITQNGLFNDEVYVEAQRRRDASRVANTAVTVLDIKDVRRDGVRNKLRDMAMKNSDLMKRLSQSVSTLETEVAHNRRLGDFGLRYFRLRVQEELEYEEIRAKMKMVYPRSRRLTTLKRMVDFESQFFAFIKQPAHKILFSPLVPLPYEDSTFFGPLPALRRAHK